MSYFFALNEDGSVYSAISAEKNTLDENTYSVSEKTYKKFLSRPSGTFGVYDPKNDEIEILEYKQDADAIAAEIKVKRDRLLSETDWTQLGDVGFPLKILEDWQDYRQALRDITKQDGFPFEITWPTPPGDPVEGE